MGGRNARKMEREEYCRICSAVEEKEAWGSTCTGRLDGWTDG